MDIKIYVCHHKEGPIFRNEFFEPIQVGKAISGQTINGIIGDDTGENISHKNKEWCELTAIYWIWKNTNHDYIGLNHYRRYMNFAKDAGNKTLLLDNNIDFLLYCSQHIEEICNTHDIITSPFCKVHQVSSPTNGQNLYENYCFNHFKNDLETTLSIIKNTQKEYYEASRLALGLDFCFFGNMLLMRRDLFDEYCNFIFPVLFEVEKTIDTTYYDYYQKRVFGFLAERLSNIFVMKKHLFGEKKRVYHAGQISLPNFAKTYDFSHLFKKIRSELQNQEIASPVGHGGTMHIVISFDDAYMEQAVTSIYSLTKNSRHSEKMSFHVIHDNRLGEHNISNIEKTFPNLSFSFYNVESDPLLEVFPKNRAHISKNTYYRLIMQDFLPADVERLIYLDLDTVICDDITQLWNTDLGDKIIAGCPDEGGLTQSRKLFGRLHNRTYINAGIFIFEIKKAKEKYKNLRFLYMESFSKNMKNITLQDQDILNISFKDDIYLIPLRWNVGTRIYGNNEIDCAYSAAEEKAAAEDPALIHFTGEEKPWKDGSNHPLKMIYFLYRDEAMQIFQSRTQRQASLI